MHLTTSERERLVCLLRLKGFDGEGVWTSEGEKCVVFII